MSDAICIFDMSAVGYRWLSAGDSSWVLVSEQLRVRKLESWRGAFGRRTECLKCYVYSDRLCNEQSC